MKDFNDKVAVITGAANGIGRAIAEICAREGMKVVLADIEAKSLSQLEKKMKDDGATVISVLTNVSKAKDVDLLAKKTIDSFGAVHLLFNNAGVSVKGPIWENTMLDWEWVMGVNLWGVIHGIRTFIPIMLKQDTECVVVNTSSGFGLIPGLGIYGITKYGITALSEILSIELKQQKAKIKVAVLCPGIINTNIVDSDRNRPVVLQNKDLDPKIEAEHERLRESSRKIFSAGISPEKVAEIVFQDIREERFYILTDALIKLPFKKRMRNILKAIELKSNLKS